MAWSLAELSQAWLKERSILKLEETLGFFSSVISPLTFNHTFIHGQRFRFWFKWASTSHNTDHLDSYAPVSDSTFHKTMLWFLHFLSPKAQLLQLPLNRMWSLWKMPHPNIRWKTSNSQVSLINVTNELKKNLYYIFTFKIL